MNLEERLIAWLELNKRPCEERDLLNDSLEELDKLTARLAAAEKERDVLLMCRHGDQRCFECPDTTCCDNLNEAAKGWE